MTVTLHSYKRSQHSGAGNCECGAAEHSFAHPHRFLPAYSDPAICVCAAPPDADVHFLGAIWTTDTWGEASDG